MSDDSTLDRALDEGAPDPDVAEDLARARLRGRLFGQRSDPVRIGRYTVLHKLGEGGNGVVFSAYDDRLDRKVALKVVRGEVARDPKRARTRLVTEAQALAKLAHPNIVTVFEVFVDEAQDVVIAMEYVDGPTLREWARAAGRTWEETLATYREAGRGLAAAHAAGMTHRDFKPSNALVGSDGRVRVLDFGLVRVGPDAPPSPSLEVSSISGPDAPLNGGDETRLGATEADTRATGDGPDSKTGVVGTPLFMPPEQHKGAIADARSDQYSFCASLWEGLFASTPYEGASLRELFAAKLQSSPSPPEDARVAPRIIEALVRGLSPAPEDRFESMDDLLAALTWNPSASRRAWWTAAAVVAAAAAGVGYGTFAQGSPCANAGASILEIWSPTVANQIDTAFAETGAAYAEPSWATARQVVDTWVSEWTQAHKDACVAHERGEQSETMLDLRTACLDDRKRELDALLEVFTSPDATVVERSVRAARALPSVTPCADVDRLRAAVPPPEDPAVEAEVEQIRTALARSHANVESGRYDQAVTLADEVQAQLRDASWQYPPIEAQALLVRGDALSRAGRIQESLPMLRRGTLLALQVGDRASFVRGATDLVWEFGDSRAEYEVAHTWADLARSSLQRMGGDDELAARLHNNLGSVLTNEQRYDEALQEHRARLELVGDSDGQAFMSLTNIGNIYNYRGQWDEAVEYYERAIDVATADVGPNHPSVLMIRGNLLGILWRVDTLERARAYGDELLATQREVLGDAHPTIVTTLSNLASIAGNAGDHNAELAYAGESLQQAEAIYGAESHLTIPALFRLSGLERKKRSFETARAHAQRALDIARASRGDDHADTAWARENMGTLSLAERRYDEALEHYAEVKRIALTAAMPEELAALAEAYSAAALCRLGRPAEALEMAKAARERFDRSTATPGDKLIARNQILVALNELGRHQEVLDRVDDLVAQWEAADSRTSGPDIARFEKMRALVALGRATPDAAAARELTRNAGDIVFIDRVEEWIVVKTPAADP